MLMKGEVMLTLNEENVLELIKKDPFMTQKEIGEHLDLPRSTVASVISSLSSKNEILGRAYVVNNHKLNIFCVGGMNVDRKFHLQGEYVGATSHPANSEIFVGGVARNVAENIGRLGVKPQLLSVAGEDQDFEFIKEQSEPYVSFQHVQKFVDHVTGSYTAVLDPQGEMVMALADMDVYDQMNKKWIRTYESILSTAQLIVIDLNTPYETVEYLLQFARQENIDVIIVSVSSPKMSHLPKELEGVQWVITNLDESEAFFNLEAVSEEDIEHITKLWLETGIEQVIITRGSKPSVYANQKGEYHSFQPPLVSQVVDVTGAGDAYTAGIIYGHLNNYSFEKTIELAMTNSYYTIQTDETVRLDLASGKLEEESNQLMKGIL